MVTVTYVLELIRDAIWPAFTGGCHYDVGQTDFSNIFHIYLWSTLAAIPIAIHLAVPPSSAWIAWLSYSIVVCIFFILSKVVASLLHWMLDTCAVSEAHNADEEAQPMLVNSRGDEVRSRAREFLSHDDSVPVELVDLTMPQPGVNQSRSADTLSSNPEGHDIAPETSAPSLAVAEVYTTMAKSLQRNITSGSARRRPPSYALQHILARLPSKRTLRRAHSTSDISSKAVVVPASLVPRRRVIIAETKLDDVSFLKEPIAASSPTRSRAVSSGNNVAASPNLFFRVPPNLPPSMRLHHRMETALSHPTLDEPFSDTEIGGTSLQALPLLSLRSPSADSASDKHAPEEAKPEQHFRCKATAQSTPFLPAPMENVPNQSVSSTVVLGLNRRMDDSIGALECVKSESQMVDVARFSQTNLPLEVQRELLHRDREIYNQRRKTTSSIDDTRVTAIAATSSQDPPAGDFIAAGDDKQLHKVPSSDMSDTVSLKWLFEGNDDDYNESNTFTRPPWARHRTGTRHVRRPSLRSQLADLRTLLAELRLADPVETELELSELHKRLERMQREQDMPGRRGSHGNDTSNRLCASSSLPNNGGSPSSSSNTVNYSVTERDTGSTPNLDSYLLNEERSGLGADGNERLTRLVTRGAPQFSSFERLITGLLTRQGTIQQPITGGPHRLTASTSVQSTTVRKRRVTCRVDRGRLKFTLLLHFDRLSLLAFMDTARAVWEIILVGLLAGVCSFLAGLLLQMGLFRDIEFLLLVVVLAACQFSLFKSVQPDPASPVHGFNPLTPYTRPVFFCIVSLMLLFVSWIPPGPPNEAIIWGVGLPPPSWLVYGCESVLYVLLLTFPLLFALGLFAQLSTATICLLEQINIHFFGGSGLSSLVGGVTSLVWSLLSVLLVVPFAYLTVIDREPERSVWLAVFCAICVPLSYHLSRQPSEVPSIFSLIIQSIRRSRDKKRKKKASKEEDTRAARAVDVDVASTPKNEKTANSQSETDDDPVFEELRTTVISRLRADFLVALVAGALVFSLQVSTVLTVRGNRFPLLKILIYLETALGCFLHYILPELRHELPWRLLSAPVLRSKWTPYAASVRPPPLTAYERLYTILAFVERNVLLVSLLLSAVNLAVLPISCNASSSDAPKDLAGRFTPIGGAVLLSVFALRAFRQSFAVTGHQWVLILFTHLLVSYDLKQTSYLCSETLLFDLFITSFLFYRLRELALKVHFVLVYSAPWQVTWGSICHALFHPLSLPHSALLLGQTALASLISAPMQPFMGSVIFLMSYPRPLKFWERTYYTRRLDNSNTRLATQLQSVNERGPSAPAADTPDNLNSVFYEQLAMSLRHHLAGDLILGRWGEVYAGDCFILASDHLNALVHIVEIGNGLVTFQLRGLELRGTYCQQRELEAICEWPGSDGSFCCCSPGHLPNFLSFNATFQQRWLAWRVVATKYVLPGYSVAETPAHTLLDSHDLKRLFLSQYVRSLIYYAIQSERLDTWLASDAVRSTIATVLAEPHGKYCDLDLFFAPPVSDDYDVLLGGISLRRFSDRYKSFVQECITRRNSRLDQGPRCSTDSAMPAATAGQRCHPDLAASSSQHSHQSDHSTVSDMSLPDAQKKLVAFSFMLAIVGRRLLATAARGSLTTTEFLLHGIHAMLKGDFRVRVGDDWVLADVELLHSVVAPAIRLAVRLLQDHFISGSNEDNDPGSVYDLIEGIDQDGSGLMSHEADPQWRASILAGRTQMTALRQIQDDAAMDDFRLISLRYTQLAFRLVRVNPECVRGLWAGQQQELIFYRNRNPERGSIQNARQVLRNMINSSCDQPLGYPIFVSPLLISLSSDHPLVARSIGPEIGFSHILAALRTVAQRIRVRCGLALLNSSSPQCSAHHLVPAPVKNEAGIELQQQLLPQQQGCQTAPCDAASTACEATSSV